MNYRNFETLKEKAITEASKVADPPVGVKEIERCDVRNVGRLIEAFPSIVPATWRGRKVTAEMADRPNGGWIVYPS